MTGALILFVLVFVFNLMPAFAPPTWLVLCLVSIKYPEANLYLLALATATGAATGRMGLARLSERIVRRRFLSHAVKTNIDVLRNALGRHEHATLGAMLLYAICPFPSTWLFIAWGLTALPIRLVALPFFVGRCVIYTTWAWAAHSAIGLIATQNLSDWFSTWFVVAQFLLLSVLYAFTRIDWHLLLFERKFGFIHPGKKAHHAPPPPKNEA